MENKKISFKDAIDSTPNLKGGFRMGLQALGANSQYIKADNTRMIEGSVDIDQCTLHLYPTAPRWDYAISYAGKVYFVEVHPAATSNVKELIQKNNWLKNWLNREATTLKSLPTNRCTYWIASGKVSILPNSPQSRQLAQSKIKLLSVLSLPQ